MTVSIPLLQQLIKVSGRLSLYRLTLRPIIAPERQLQLLLPRFTSLSNNKRKQILRAHKLRPNVPDARTRLLARSHFLLHSLVPRPVVLLLRLPLRPPVPRLFEVEELDVFSRTPRPTSTQLPNSKNS